jgi:hypothetical protein
MEVTKQLNERSQHETQKDGQGDWDQNVAAEIQAHHDDNGHGESGKPAKARGLSGGNLRPARFRVRHGNAIPSTHVVG